MDISCNFTRILSKLTCMFIHDRHHVECALLHACAPTGPLGARPSSRPLKYRFHQINVLLR